MTQSLPRRAALLGLLLAPSLGCYGFAKGTETSDAASAGVTADAGSTDGATGLPCNVQSILQTYCVACHSGATAGGPAGGVSLVTYADLVAPDPTTGGSTVLDAVCKSIYEKGQQSGGAHPMPPVDAGPALSLADFFILERYCTSGPAHGGGDPRTGAEAGAAGECAPPPTLADPYSSAEICTSGTYWDQGSNGDEHMHPGAACISCHSFLAQNTHPPPNFKLAGTVFPTANEPTDCDGLAGVTVVIKGPDGAVQYTLKTNSAGNFFSGDTKPPATAEKVTFPITASITRNGHTLEMTTPQMTGDCNSCHANPPLNGAPGRIIAPPP